MAKQLHPQAAELLERVRERGVPPADALPVNESRRLLEELLVGRGEPVPLEAVQDLSIPGPAASIPIRIYRPDRDSPLPVLVYYHGGGFYAGSIETHDGVCRRIANAAGCIVVSVSYRLPPEDPFPAPLEDAYTAFKWTSKYAESIHGDPSRVLVGGDSAGANLATATALLARERTPAPSVAYQVLLYPAVNYLQEMDSYDEMDGYFTTYSGVKRLWKHYLRSDVCGHNPFAFPLHADDHGGLPPAFVLTCEFDVWRDEGVEYAERLAASNVSVEHAHVDDMFHPFLNFPELERTKEVYEEMGNHLRAVFRSKL